MNATRLFSLAFALALLAGCGNKGPLVLPAQPAPIDPATAPEAPTDAVDADTTDATDATDATESADEAATPEEVPVDTPRGDGGDANG